MKPLRPPYLYLHRQHIWRRQYYWSLWHRPVGAPAEELAGSNHAQEIFDFALKSCRRLCVPLRGKWRGALRRYHRRRAFAWHPPSSGRRLREQQYSHRRRIAAKRMQMKTEKQLEGC
jgi:hypothetical protein